MYIIKNALCSIKAAKLRTLILAVVAMVLSAVVCFCLMDIQSVGGEAAGNPFEENPFESGGGFQAFWDAETPAEAENTEEGQMPDFAGNPFEGFPTEEGTTESSEMTAEWIPEEAASLEEVPSAVEETETQEPPEDFEGFPGFDGEGFGGFPGFDGEGVEEFSAPEGENSEGFTPPEGFEGFTAPEGEDPGASEGEGFEGFTMPEGEEFGGFGGFGGFGDFAAPEGMEGFMPPDGTEEAAAPEEGSELTGSAEEEADAALDSSVEGAEGEETGMPPFEFEGFEQPGMDASEGPGVLEEFLSSLDVSPGMLALVFLASLVILFAAGGILARSRRNETLVLAVIGLGRGQIGWQYFLEHLLTAIVAAAVAVGVCAAVLGDLSGLVILEMVPVAVLFALISAILPIRTARRTDPVRVLAEKA